jgi:hypothetical protein
MVNKWKSLPSFSLHETTAILPSRRKQGSSMMMPNIENIKKNKTRRDGTMYQAAFDTGDYKPIAFASSLHNEAIAIGSRVLKATPPPVNFVSHDYVNFVKRNFDKIFPNWRRVEPVPFDVYLKHSNATPAVKKILQQTKDELDRNSVGYNMVSSRDAYRWTTRSSFVKVENLLYNSPAEAQPANELGLTTIGNANPYKNREKAPRLIQGAQPEFICLMGPLFMAIQGMLKKVWNKKNSIFFTSGSNNVQVSKPIVEASGRWLEDDVSAFDSSVNRDICELELWITKKLGANPLQLQLFEFNIRTHGFTHFGIKYSVVGTRKSGDPFTSVYNSVLNGCMHLWAYCLLAHKPVSTALQEIKMIVQGDDNVLRHPGEKLDFHWLLMLLGFDCEANYRQSEYDVEFCSNIFYDTTVGVVFGPKPGRVLAKFGYFINPPANLDPLGVLRGVSIGLIEAASFVPIIRSVIDRILVVTSGHREQFIREHSFAFKYVKAKSTSVYPMLNRYDFDAFMVEQLEKMVSNLKIGDKLDHPYFEALMDRDTDARKSIYVRFN